MVCQGVIVGAKKSRKMRVSRYIISLRFFCYHNDIFGSLFFQYMVLLYENENNYTESENKKMKVLIILKVQINSANNSQSENKKCE